MQRLALTKAATPLLLVLTTGWVTAIGCGRPVARTFAVYPVDGQLFMDGEPAVGAEVTFVPNAGQPEAKAAMAKVRADGHFVPTQPDGAIGLPEGDYALTVRWPAGPGAGGTPASGASLSIGSCTVIPGVNLLPPIRVASRRP